METDHIHHNLHRSLPHGLRNVVGELELRGATLVSAEEVAAYAGVAAGSPAAYDIIRRLVAARWLRPLPVKGHYEFLPGAAGPFCARMPSTRCARCSPGGRLPARSSSQVPRSSAGSPAVRRTGSTWPSLAPVDLAVPSLALPVPLRGTGADLRSRAGRRRPRVHAGAPPARRRALAGRGRRGPRDRDHWLGRALAEADTSSVIDMLRRLDSPTATARAGYLAGAFGRDDLADAVASLGRSRVLSRCCRRPHRPRRPA